MKRVMLILLALLCSEAAFAADTVYRSVNEKGEVVYSSQPTEGGEEVKIAPGPTKAQMEEAKRREQVLKQAAEKGQVRRDQTAQERKQAVAERTKAVAEAKKQLEEAKIYRDDDWQYVAGGKRHLKPSYFERVEQAEKALEAAKKRLKQ